MTSYFLGACLCLTLDNNLKFSALMSLYRQCKADKKRSHKCRGIKDNPFDVGDGDVPAVWQPGSGWIC